MWTRSFWKDTAERTVATACQSALALLGVDALGVLDVDWEAVGSVAGLAAVVAVLKALIASQTSEPPTPSFVEPAGLPSQATPGPDHAA